MSKLQDALEDALDELGEARDLLENIREVEAKGARIAYSCVEYPNARVYLDVVGNVVSVRFDGLGWDAT